MTRRRLWSITGVLFAWLVLCAFVQEGPGGYLKAFTVLFAGTAVVLVIDWLGARLAGLWCWLLAGSGLLCWVVLAGSYSLPRDAAAFGLALASAFALWPQGRRWIADLRAGRRGPPPQQPRLALTWLLLGWLLASAGDAVWERGVAHGPAAHARSPAVLDRWERLRVGVALSGGGYRAALVHAGVLHQLALMGVPVTHLSTVSGGSIIGAYLATGGSPGVFVDAVRAGRFRFFRDLTDAQNLVRLPAPAVLPWLDVDVWPFGAFSRLDVQARLLDRVLLDGARAGPGSARPGPELMVAMTDLRHGLSVGMLREGALLIGPIVVAAVRTAQSAAASRGSDAVPVQLPKVFFDREELRLDGLDTLAARVAVSGAFPGAFPPHHAHARLDLPAGAVDVPLLLADGGIRDNLGLNLLEVADLAARAAPDGNAPPGRWALDLILSSDGGQAFRPAAPDGTLETIARAIDLSGLETGAVRLMPSGGTPKKILLTAAASFIVTPDAIAQGFARPGRPLPAEQIVRPGFPLPQLEALADIPPDSAAARRALERWLAADGDGAPDVGSLRERCPDRAGDVEPDCSWWAFVSRIGADIGHSVDVFLRTPTLADSFAAQDVDALFRFGRYLVAIRQPEIATALDDAARRAAALRGPARTADTDRGRAGAHREPHAADRIPERGHPPSDRSPSG